MVVVIADAGPVIALAKINQLHLLAALFPTLTITQAVADECLRHPSADALIIKHALNTGWLQCVSQSKF